MAVTITGEEEHPEQPRLRLVPTPETVQARPEHVAPPPPSQPVFPTKEVVAVLTAISYIIAVRLILLLAFVANAGLFYLATVNPTAGSITAASMFAALVFWPLAWLALKKG